MSVDWIETFSGKRFKPQNPDPKLIDIIDIAHSLSLKTRYSGHCKEFYSVAQHSVIVSEMVPQQYALEGLLHDAAEAYFPDVPRPMRPIVDCLDQVEDRIHQAVAERFGLVYPYPFEVVKADATILSDEARQLMHSGGLHWKLPYKGYGYKITPASPKMANRMFVERYDQLITERNVEDPWHFKALMRERRRNAAR